MNELPRPIDAKTFFAGWKNVCGPKRKGKDLLGAWTSPPEYTAQVFDGDNSVVKELETELGLKVYCGYYSLDAIFFAKADRVHCAPDGQTWVQNIQIAFEHENFFRSGLFQEVSHLLITRAELRVLVSYHENEAELSSELSNLARVIADSTLAKEDPRFLFVVGKRICNDTDIEWSAYTYQGGKLLPLAQ